MTLVLFDIDGTLLHSDGCGSAATRPAMLEVFGTVGWLDNFRFGGKTDWQMLLETLDTLVPPEEIQARLEIYDQALARHLEAIIPHYDVRACAGARVLLDRCAASSGVIYGILTANMPRAAWIKLRQAGYRREEFAFGVFGSEAPDRIALTPLALERANRLGNGSFVPEQTVIIGDTPEDIACARAIGAHIIAVGTGRYSKAELETYRPDMALENLTSAEDIFAYITRCGSG